MEVRNKKSGRARGLVVILKRGEEVRVVNERRRLMRHGSREGNILMAKSISDFVPDRMVKPIS